MASTPMAPSGTEMARNWTTCVSDGRNRVSPYARA